MCASVCENLCRSSVWLPVCPSMQKAERGYRDRESEMIGTVDGCGWDVDRMWVECGWELDGMWVGCGWGVDRMWMGCR